MKAHNLLFLFFFDSFSLLSFFFIFKCVLKIILSIISNTVGSRAGRLRPKLQGANFDPLAGKRQN